MDLLRQPNWHDAGLSLSWDKAEQTPDPDRFAFPIDTIVRLRAKQTPDAPAILWQDDVLSFSEFDRLVDHCAFSIMADYGDNDGLQGARLGVEVRKASSTLVLLFAALRAGAIVVPLNPALKPDQFRHIATDCQMRAGFVSSNTAAALNTVDKSTQWVSFTPGSAENNTRGSRQTSQNPQPLPALNAQHTALLFYTSGSTGKPKGVMVSHHNNVLGAASVAHFLSLSRDDRVLTVLPLSFDYGFNQLVSTWLAGGAAVLHDFFLASDVVKAVQRYAVTGLGAVPPLWHLILGASWKDGAGDSLRYLTNSGGKLSTDLQHNMAKTFPNAEVFAMYGLTEAFRSTVLPPHRLSDKPHSVGTPIPFAQVAVVDENGFEAPSGQPGELVHAGPLVAQGYWGNAEKTAQRYRALPPALKDKVDPRFAKTCVFSGDRMMRDEDGDLHFCGRLDEMIKVLGNRLSPQEVEDVAQSVEGVGAVAAFGIDDETVGALVILVAEGESDSALEHKLQEACRQHLPAYAVPKHIFLRQALPRSANGKIDRPHLKKWVVERLAV